MFNTQLKLSGRLETAEQRTRNWYSLLEYSEKVLGAYNTEPTTASRILTKTNISLAKLKSPQPKQVGNSQKEASTNL